MNFDSHPMATNEMIRLVAMYPNVWFMDTTAGQSYLFYLLFEFMYYMNVGSRYSQ